MFDEGRPIRIVESNIATGHAGPTRHSLGYVQSIYPKYNIYMKESILTQSATILFFRYGKSHKLRLERKLVNLALPYLTNAPSKNKLSKHQFTNFLTKIKLLNKNKKLCGKLNLPLTVVATPYLNPQPIQNIPLLQQEALFESFKNSSYNLVLNVLRLKHIRPSMNFLPTDKLKALNKLLSLNRKSLHIVLSNLSIRNKEDYIITYNKVHSFIGNYWFLHNTPQPDFKNYITTLRNLNIVSSSNNTSEILQWLVTNLFSMNNLQCLNLLINNLDLFPNLINTAYRLLEAKYFLQNM